MTHNRDPLTGDLDTLSSSSEYRPARLQRRSYFIALTLALLGLSISLVNIFRAPQKQQEFSLSDLSYSQVINLFDNGAPEIIVTHPFGIDTLRKDSDYILLRDKIASQISESGLPSDGSRGNGEFSDETWSTQETPDQEKLPILRLDVAGSREAGSILDFTIEDYDPSVFYYIDFGDGYRRKVDKESVFTYSKPGVFNLNLYASISEKELYSSYSKEIRIRPSTQKYSSSPRPNNNSIADLFPDKEADKLINKPTFDPEKALAKKDPSKNEASVDTSFSSKEEIQISDLGFLKDKEVIEKNNTIDLNSGVSPNEDPELIIGTSVDKTKKFNKPYFDAEMMPEFPGGLKAMARYLKKNAIYPERASQSNIEGTVNVRLVVRADGSLSDLKVLNGLGYGCDDEALRLVSKMPRWIPGVQNGISVPVYTVIPITFKLIQ